MLLMVIGSPALAAVAIGLCFLPQTSSVLLADEVTAALDAQTACQVTSDILKLAGMTRVIVTRALAESLFWQYDGIIVLKDGPIVEKGALEDLMA